MKCVWIFRTITFIIAFSLISFADIGHAQDITFEAAVDKTQMSYEDVVVLRLCSQGGMLI